MVWRAEHHAAFLVDIVAVITGSTLLSEVGGHLVPGNFSGMAARAEGRRFAEGAAAGIINEKAITAGRLHVRQAWPMTVFASYCIVYAVLEFPLICGAPAI